MKIWVKGLGPIKEAEVELKPLTIFIGKNKTGKSYFLRFLSIIFQKPLLHLGRVQERKISDFEIFLEYFETSITREEIINVEGLKIEDFEVPLYKKIEEKWILKISINKKIHKEKRSEILREAIKENIKFNFVYYLPSSRSGILLLIRPLTKIEMGIYYKLKQISEEQAEKLDDIMRTNLPWSIYSYYKGISSVIREAGTFDFNKFGKFLVKQGEIYYEEKEAIPFFNISSGLQELFPILYLMKMEAEESLFLIDEPESHLHPEWQVELAKEIVTNVKENNNWFVLSTHSDIFFLALISEVLEGLKNKKGEIKKEEIDKFLAIYLFKEDGTVEKIDLTEEGLTNEQWSEINSELLGKYIELIQGIRSENNNDRRR